MNQKSIRLQLLTENEMGLMLRLTGNPEVTRYLPTMLTDQAMLEQWLLSLGPDDYEWVIYSAETTAPIGECSLTVQQDGESCEIGLMLLPEYWNQGFGTAVVNALLHRAEGLGMEKITASIMPQNTACVRIFEKAGFEKSADDLGEVPQQGLVCYEMKMDSSDPVYAEGRKKARSIRFHQEVRLVPYQEDWPHRFHSEKQWIIGALLTEGITSTVRHIGSTSIPGMCAKPIVDLLVLVNKEVLKTAEKLLVEIGGYHSFGECGRSGRIFLSTGDTAEDACYVHLTTPDNPCAVSQLAFQQKLMESSELRQQYMELKKRLARLYPHDRESYRLEKGGFIEACLQETL